LMIWMMQELLQEWKGYKKKKLMIMVMMMSSTTTVGVCYEARTGHYESESNRR
jgi:hypothetical protein